MEKQHINDYFIMLGKVFEWICYESKDEVELSAVYYKNNQALMKPFPMWDMKSGLCIGTIMSACKAFDKEHGTDFYDKFMFAKDNGVEHTD